VSDFETKKPEFELYSYGEETVVVPIRGKTQSPSHSLAANSIKDEFLKYVEDVDVEVISDHKAIVRVPESQISKIIGREGKNISGIEKTLGIGIDIQTLNPAEQTKTPIPFDTQVSKKSIQIILDTKNKNRDVDIIVGGDYLLSAKAGKTGMIKITKNNKIGKILLDAINTGEDIEVRLH